MFPKKKVVLPKQPSSTLTMLLNLLPINKSKELRSVLYDTLRRQNIGLHKTQTYGKNNKEKKRGTYKFKKTK